VRDHDGPPGAAKHLDARTVDLPYAFGGEHLLGDVVGHDDPVVEQGQAGAELRSKGEVVHGGDHGQVVASS